MLNVHFCQSPQLTGPDDIVGQGCRGASEEQTVSGTLLDFVNFCRHAETSTKRTGGPDAPGL